MRRVKTGLGRSNDKPAAVKIEMRAAALAVHSSSATPGEDVGYAAHVNSKDYPPSPAADAGWLEREICTVTEWEPPGCWPWDVTRPVAEQYPDADFEAALVSAMLDTDEHGGVDQGQIDELSAMVPAAAPTANAIEADHSKLIALIAQAPDIEPPDGWQGRALARIDAEELLDAMSPEQVAELDAMTRGLSVDGESCSLLEEQTRHDVAQSVARHSAAERKPYDIDDPDSVNPLCGMTNRRIDEISEAYLKESLSEGDDEVLDGIDQSEPTTPSDSVRDASRGPRNTDDEATHVGDVDKRFEDGDGL